MPACNVALTAPIYNAFGVKLYPWECEPCGIKGTTTSIAERTKEVAKHMGSRKGEQA